MKKQVVLKLIILVVLVLFVNTADAFASGRLRPEISNGVLDLRDWDFRKDGIVDLTGKWQLIWNKHLSTYAQSNAVESSEFSFIHVPGTWNGHRHLGQEIPSHGFASYRLKILHPSRPTRLALKILDMATAGHVYINGQLVFTSGFPGKTKDSTKPRLATGVVEFVTTSNQTEILVHVSNFHHRKGGMWETMYLGDARDIRKDREKSLLIGFFLLGSILIMGFYHVGLYWTRKDDKASLYFGVFCILMGVRMLATGERYIHQMIPGLTFEWHCKIVYLSLYLCVPFFIMYAKSLFTSELSSKIVAFSQIMGSAFSLLVLFTPARVYSHSMPVYHLLTVLILCYGTWVVWLAVRRHRDGARIFLAGFLVFMVTAVNDILYANLIIYTGYTIQIGIFVFIFSQAVIIARRFSTAYTIIDKQRLQLETANRDYAQELSQRKKVQRQFSESEQKYRLIAEHATDIIWILNLSNLTFDYVSPSLERIRGFSMEEARELKLEEHLSPESFNQALTVLDAELAIDDEPGIDKNRSQTIEIQQSTKDRGYLWTEATMSFIRDENDKPISVMGVSRDIEERKRAEAELIESEKKYRNLFENGSDLLCIHDLEGNLVETNIHYKTEYGWTQADLANLNIREVLPDKFKEDFDRYLTEILANGVYAGYMTAQTKSGDTIVLEYRNNLIYDNDGQPMAVHGAARDVTERYKAEKALKESEEKYKGLFQHSPAGIYEFDMHELRFLSVNEVMCEYTGYTESEFLNLDPFELLSDESKVQLNNLVEDVFLNKPKELTTEYKIKGKNQSEFWVLANAKFFYEDGEPVKAMAVVHDLTEIRRAQEEQKRLQKKLQNARKLESLGTLAGGVAHDLNNILSGIVSYPDLILLDLDDDSPLRAPLLAIKKSGEKAADIVQDLLTLARRGVEHRKVIDLNQVINDFRRSPEYQKILLANDDVRIDTNLDSKSLNIVGSETHIAKSLMNLLANAVDAMPAGGEVKIRTRSCYIDMEYSGYEPIPEGEYTVLEIDDKGIGISAADLERIFEPFYTKKSMGRSGTGLGMSVVWGTVKDHGGYIDVESKEGFGATFRLYFPASRSETEETTTLHIEDYLGRGESVLVIDDSEDQRDLACRMIQRLGYAVYSASSGKEAVQMVQSRRYDLLILDMIMPPGIDGLTTYQQILEIVPNQKAVIASGYAENERVREALRIGAGAYIKKPFTLEVIGVAVRSELDRDSKSQN